MVTKLTVTLRRSPIGYPQDQRATVRSLGLRRVNQTVSVQDTPAARGMVRKVEHLLRVVEVEVDE